MRIGQMVEVDVCRGENQFSISNFSFKKLCIDRVAKVISSTKEDFVTIEKDGEKWNFPRRVLREIKG